MQHLSLFSGIGGIDLAAHWAGFETVAFCEKNQYCQKVLAQHWPGVPIYDDIHTLSAESMGVKPGTIILLSGGFPCQSFSFAGKRKGHDDDRYLWPEMLRVIREVRPNWICGENVAGIVSMALDTVCADLEAENYEVQALVLPACAVGAWHIRQRVFIVAHNDQLQGRERHNTNLERGRQEKAEQTRVGSGDVTDPERQSLALRESQRRNDGQEQSAIERDDHSFRTGGQWSVEPELDRMVYGLSSRLDKSLNRQRLHALGNAVVPQQVYPILKAVADYEKEVGNDKSN
jgi:DNA (cytosine-5)-methyltransferase 1